MWLAGNVCTPFQCHYHADLRSVFHTRCGFHATLTAPGWCYKHYRFVYSIITRPSTLPAPGRNEIRLCLRHTSECENLSIEPHNLIGQGSCSCLSEKARWFPICSLREGFLREPLIRDCIPLPRNVFCRPLLVSLKMFLLLTSCLVFVFASEKKSVFSQLFLKNKVSWKGSYAMNDCFGSIKTS